MTFKKIGKLFLSLGAGLLCLAATAAAAPAQKVQAAEGGRVVPHYDIREVGGTWDETNGNYYLPNGTKVTDAFFCDGTYTYYLMADGTPMKDRLTYHPDGEHVIYFDEKGHEVFNSFTWVVHNIPDMETGIATVLNEYCYFGMLGYQYTDVLTYGNEETGTENDLLYANTSGILERKGWFQFSETLSTPWGSNKGMAGGYGYANENGTLMKDQHTYWNGNLVYMEADGHVRGSEKQNGADDQTPGNDPGNTGNQDPGNDPGNTGNEDPGNDPGNTGNQDPGDATDTNYDCGGATVRVYGNAWNKLNENDSNYLLGRAYADELEKKYNIKLEYVNIPNDYSYNITDYILLSLANGECFADILSVDNGVMLGLKDYLADITGAKDQLKMGSLFLDAATWAGNCYGFSCDNLGDIPVLVYNRDYLIDIGMDVTPTEMFLNGNWSYDDCIEYLSELKSILPEGAYPITVNGTYWERMASAANGSIAVDSDGGIHLTDDNYVEALEFYRELMARGLATPAKMVEKDDDGNVISYIVGENQSWTQVNDMCVVGDARGCVITCAELWQIASHYSYNDDEGAWGIVPWPWGSAVTCEGDYTTLSPEYRASQYSWYNMVAPEAKCRAAGTKNIPDSVLFQIAKDWCDLNNPDGAAVRTAMYNAEKAGQPYEYLGYEPGTPRYFSTKEDVDLYDWLHSRVILNWSYAVNNLGYVRTSRNAVNIIIGGDDGKASGKKFEAEGRETLMDYGLIRK